MVTQYKGERMELNIALVLLNIWTAISGLLTSVWGKVLVFGLFIGATFSSISGLLHIILILTFIDLVFGVSVTINKRGRGKITSSKLRNSLYKTFFYLIFIMLIYLIESTVVTDSVVTSKLAFAIISAVELWSIASNAIILMPNMPFLKIFRKYLGAEIAKKLEIDESEVEDILNKKSEEDKNKDSSGSK